MAFLHAPMWAIWMVRLEYLHHCRDSMGESRFVGAPQKDLLAVAAVRLALFEHGSTSNDREKRRF